jgi:cholesterol transport system auxiliary component
MRRRLLLATPLLLAGCGLAERPYAERRSWPLEVPRPGARPRRSNGKILLVRAVRAGPGLDARGLQSIQPDGSIQTAFYEEWAVPPAQGVEDSLRRWLADSGLFAAVVAPGSRLSADWVLEGELDALWTEPAHGTAQTALGITVVDSRGDGTRVQLQRRFAAEAPLTDPAPPGQVAAMRAALAAAFGQIESALALG